MADKKKTEPTKPAAPETKPVPADESMNRFVTDGSGMTIDGVPLEDYPAHLAKKTATPAAK